jgi:hypothetical protein
LAVVSCQQEAQSQRGGGLLSLGQLAPIRENVEDLGFVRSPMIFEIGKESG